MFRLEQMPWVASWAHGPWYGDLCAENSRQMPEDTVPWGVKAVAGDRRISAVQCSHSSYLNLSQGELELGWPCTVVPTWGQGADLCTFSPSAMGRLQWKTCSLACLSSLSFSLWMLLWRGHSDILKQTPTHIFFLKKFTLRELAPWLTTCPPAPDWLTWEVSTQAWLTLRSLLPSCQGTFPQDLWSGPRSHPPPLCLWHSKGG